MTDTKIVPSTSSPLPPVRFVDTNGIRLAVYDEGSGPAVLLLHGFLGLAYSWRHQFSAFVRAGYRVIAVDQRGYGLSDRPAAVEAYDMANLTADLVGVLDALGIEKAIVVGHDWGAGVAWQMPLHHPIRVAGVVALNVAYVPDGQLWLHPIQTKAVAPEFVPDPNVDPIEQMRRVYKSNMYVLSMHDSDHIDKLMVRDVRRTFATCMRRGVLTSAQYVTFPPDAKHMELFQPLEGPEPDTSPGTAILSDEELDFYVEKFERTGFTPGLNWYRNWSRNWQANRNIDQTINVPSLMIAAEDDVTLAPNMMDGMESFVPDVEKHVVRDCGHFSLEEKPGEVTGIVIDWLQRRFPV
ncbi:alpha/beta fold hydrolase [Xanthomonas hortorum pv. vitians]|uniref:Alpha/beta hydrolase n=1 Tax=Xanthomonas hortorum pv. vitians TaxID=83224 RepID=A0A6V7BFU9_9XANT|nr:alpha/beta hydrolase [Xanthomonas hortorum]APP86332.1 hypothetical protein BI317_21515 [Xanthomonas hortorum pv. gardneri]ASW47659.1 hypothetical protein XJ27_18145 [Xanthomonas hortorum]MCC8493615.1 alpha/beta hydrolase [Xanthomonas hortorum pv. gardneri]MCC8554076.1 alpha/beta hydrolase [Xanthomonas hortorum pv. gardneri]MCE4299327.1 alpha/beta hydrolase [Xanthomonas hortorum pv. vitians]